MYCNFETLCFKPPNTASIPLQRLCKIILNLYCPLLLSIKKNCFLRDAAKNYFFAIQLARDCLVGQEVTKFKEVMQRNSYNASIEMVIIAAMFDQNVQIREFAINGILNDRKRQAQTRPILIC